MVYTTDLKSVARQGREGSIPSLDMFFFTWNTINRPYATKIATYIEIIFKSEIVSLVQREKILKKEGDIVGKDTKKW